MPLSFSTSQHPPAIVPAARLRHLIADFLWEGSFRRLVFAECHNKPEAAVASASLALRQGLSLCWPTRPAVS
jgi:hypothetical protein